MQLKGKLFIKGRILALTGLHIGGSKTDVAIGEIENSVIKTSQGIPYIPGSSLKGKIRSLLEKTKLNNIIEKNSHKENYICNCGKCNVCVIFGAGAGCSEDVKGSTRLIVRDAYLNQKTIEKMENKEGEFGNLHLTYTESKWENSINRLTSKADNPRQTERVPSGAEFDFQFIYNIMEDKDIDERFKELLLGLSLLEDDYLGGSGSRGYGKVKFIIDEISLKTIKNYLESNTTPINIAEKMDTLEIIKENENEILNKIRQALGEDENENL
ncbi:CRISPR-associated protein Csm3 [Anaerobranca californiensis DSM 14826]|jgi:CRISPR-associated protein Csm3|uniref:CRISPR system Cms endoribonuclease Csm3 n=1 Tax=Anaerobranca californiensis DSM 14826 TaxID=1120989 RepID=A0A1M6QLE7_9FIRM|nr:type III-A CRISPR-associated RAMP protein Csm3 [Anaerobranca californiensis]SHK20837.1 CRISPR-associated protein Csm3 [Anaerobranca californiensis DSM 14826]